MTMTTMTLPQHLQLSPTTTIAQLSSSSSSNPYLIEQLHHMLHQESTPHYQISSDYLTNPYATVTSSDRRTMATWSYDIVDACSIEREVACIAMTYFDRFMDTTSTTAPLSSATKNSNSNNNNNKHRAKACLTSRREFQLAFITCLIIALKCRAGMQVDSDFVSSTICQGLYAEDEIIEMEHDILNGLGWRLNGPSGHEFVAGFLELLPSGCGAGAATNKVGDTLKTMAGLQIELAMLDYDMALQKPSSIAYAAIMTALSNHVGSTTVVSLLHPVERMEWIERIALVTGMTADDDSGYTSSSLYTTMPSSPVRVSPYTLPSTTSSPSIVMCTPQHHERSTFVHQVSMMSSHNNSSYQDHNVMQYCSPVSSEDSYQEETPYDTVFEQHLYLDKCFDDNDDDDDDECCSMGSEDSDLSPVCAMFDGGLEFTTRA